MKHLRINLLLAVFVSTFTTACDHMPPECADPKVLDMLKSIEAENLQKGFTHVKFTVDRFESADPHTLSVDEKIKARTCAVDMKYKITDEAQSLWNAPNDDPRINTIARELLKAVSPMASAMMSAVKDTGPMDQSLVNSSMCALSTSCSIPAGPMDQSLVNSSMYTVKAEAQKMFSTLGGLDNQRISLAAPTLNYTLRNNEDKSKHSDYIVEAAISQSATEAIHLLESFSEIVAVKSALSHSESTSSTTESPVPQSLDAEPPHETVPDGTQAPSSMPGNQPAESQPVPSTQTQSVHDTLFVPEAGTTYLQVTALHRSDADNLVKTLAEQNLPSVLGESLKSGLFRVLVGPYHQPAEVANAKARLKALGFANTFVQK
jgi:cell division septation protein DedD